MSHRERASPPPTSTGSASKAQLQKARPNLRYQSQHQLAHTHGRLGTPTHQIRVNCKVPLVFKTFDRTFVSCRLHNALLTTSCSQNLYMYGFLGPRPFHFITSILVLACHPSSSVQYLKWQLYSKSDTMFRYASTELTVQQPLYIHQQEVHQHCQFCIFLFFSVLLPHCVTVILCPWRHICWLQIISLLQSVLNNVGDTLFQLRLQCELWRIPLYF